MFKVANKGPLLYLVIANNVEKKKKNAVRMPSITSLGFSQCLHFNFNLSFLFFKTLT